MKSSSSLMKRKVAESPTPKYLQKFVRVDQRLGKGLQSQDFHEPGVLAHTLGCICSSAAVGRTKAGRSCFISGQYELHSEFCTDQSNILNLCPKKTNKNKMILWFYFITYPKCTFSELKVFFNWMIFSSICKDFTLHSHLKQANY